jgi:transcriptional regulator with XRE-family HTH domain
LSELTGVGQRIREAREVTGLTQRRTSEILKVTIGTVQAWEYERANLTLSRAAQLGQLYNVSIDWIATGKETNAGDPLLQELRTLVERRSAAKP